MHTVLRHVWFAVNASLVARIALLNDVSVRSIFRFQGNARSMPVRVESGQRDSLSWFRSSRQHGLHTANEFISSVSRTKRMRMILSLLRS